VNAGPAGLKLLERLKALLPDVGNANVANPLLKLPNYEDFNLGFLEVSAANRIHLSNFQLIAAYPARLRLAPLKNLLQIVFFEH